MPWINLSNVRIKISRKVTYLDKGSIMGLLRGTAADLFLIYENIVAIKIKSYFGNILEPMMPSSFRKLT